MLQNWLKHAVWQNMWQFMNFFAKLLISELLTAYPMRSISCLAEDRLWICSVVQTQLLVERLINFKAWWQIKENKLITLKLCFFKTLYLFSNWRIIAWGTSLLESKILCYMDQGIIVLVCVSPNHDLSSNSNKIGIGPSIENNFVFKMLSEYCRPQQLQLCHGGKR